MAGYTPKSQEDIADFDMQNAELAAVESWLKDSGSVLAYDDWEWDDSEPGVLIVFAGSDVERYTRAELLEAKAFDHIKGYKEWALQKTSTGG